jgi:hypothetical protein
MNRPGDAADSEQWLWPGLHIWMPTLTEERWPIRLRFRVVREAAAS